MSKEQEIAAIAQIAATIYAGRVEYAGIDEKVKWSVDVAVAILEETSKRVEAAGAYAA